MRIRSYSLAPLVSLTPVVLASTLLGLTLLSGCAGRAGTAGSTASDGSASAAEQDPVQWRLTPAARDTYYYLLYEDARASGDLTTASKALSLLLEGEGSVELYREAVGFSLRAGMAEEAKAFAKQGLHRYPIDAELTLLLAQIYVREKRVEDASTTLLSYLESHPDDDAVRHQLVTILLDAERFAEALDALDGAPRSTTPFARFLKAKALGGLALRQEAIQELELALKDEPEMVEALVELAYLHELEKDYVAAEAVYTRILELREPGEASEELWLRLIDLNLKLNNAERGLTLAKDGPETLSFTLSAATLFIDQGFYDEADILVDSVADRANEQPGIHFYKAVIAFEGRDDAEGALAALSQVPEESRYHQRALRFRVHLLEQLGESEESLALAQQGIDAYPDDKGFWLLKTQLLEKLGRLAEAEDLAAAAVERFHDTEVLYLHGVILDRLGRRDEAISVMERIIQIAPDHADALNYVGYVLADENRELDRARVLIREALNQKPDAGYILDSMAWVLYRLGEHAEAWTHAKRAVADEVGDPVIWYHYAEIAAALGKKQEAAEGYRKALAMEGTFTHRDEVREKLRALEAEGY